MKPKIIFTLIFSMSIILNVSSQRWNWFFYGQGNAPDYINGIEMSADHSIYSGMTTFSDPINIGSNSFNINGIMDIFLFKLSSAGNELWMNQVGGPFWPYPQSLRYDAINSIEIDPVSNCIYIFGSYVGPCDFGGIVLNSDDQDLFLAKYTSEGNCLWAKRMGSSGMDRPFSMAVDQSGNLNLCAFFPYIGNFGDIEVSYGGFIAKYNPEGSCLWAKQIFQIEQCNDLPNYFLMSAKSINESVYFSGYGHGVITIDTISFPTNGYAGQFIAKFNLDGDVQWVNHFGGPLRGNILEEFDIDEEENIYLTASFSGEYGTFGSDTIYSTAEREPYIMKINSEGELVWLKQGHSTQFANGYGTDIDSDGMLYITGNFSGNLSFDNLTIHSDTDNDLFILQMDKEGTLLNSFQTGGIVGLMVRADKLGKVVIAGSLIDTVWINNTQLIGEPSGDIFIGQCILPDNQSVLDEYCNMQLLIYANPTTGLCSITIPEELQNEDNLSLLVYDHFGKLILKETISINESSISLNLEAQAKGMYNAILTDGKRRFQGKIVFE